MNTSLFSKPLDPGSVAIQDAFWTQEIELIRNEVIPYQWNALNDRIPDAAKSFCMRNFQVAGHMKKQKMMRGKAFVEPTFTFRGFEALPEDPEHPDPDKFYGFVFQDSDFSKWIEAVAYSLAQRPDSELEQLADGAIDIVCDAQQEDGYLDTYYIINGRDKSFTNLKDHHELYCFGHLVEGAVAYYKATGKQKLLDAAIRFADYIDSCFGNRPEQCKGYPGHEIAEMALVRLYEVTGEKRYLNLAKFFVEQRGQKPLYYFGELTDAECAEIRAACTDEREETLMPFAYNQAHLPVREQKEAVGHAVRAVYLYSGMADLAREFADASMQKACEDLWDNVTTRKMYITGGIGATHLGEAFSFEYDLPNDTAYSETCASIGMVFWGRRMLQMDPDSRYADVCELELYNGILSGMALDGKSFFYVNPLEVYPKANLLDERKFHVKPVRQKWFGCACCPPNIARLVSSIASYAFTENEDTLWIHQYIGSSFAKDVHGQELKLHLESGFPWNGAVKIRVEGTGIPATIALRIPGWTKNYTLTGGEDAEKHMEKGYLYLTKVWGEEEILNLDFPMEIRLMSAGDQVREDENKAAYMYGPLVYCLESCDNGENLHEVRLNPYEKAEQGVLEIQGHPTICIRAEGYRKQRSQNPLGQKMLYTQWEKTTWEETKLTMIPYFMWANRGENEMQVWTAVRE